MTNRRRFLAFLGIGVVAPSVLLKGDEPKRRRSRWDMMFSSPDTKQPIHRPDPASWSDRTITAAWIGHATVLINFFGTWIVTDPVFSERIGIRIFGMTVGPKRLVYPALKISDLPKVDLILLSHAHMDHLDIPSLEYFDPDIPVIMAKNTVDVVDGLAFRFVQELDWGEKAHVSGVEIEALQVKHFGWRWPWEDDRSKGVWEGRSYNAYLISKNGKSIVFGGDTAKQDFFKEVGARKLDIALAMMPIGAYDPWIRNHCNPEQAVEMAHHLGAKSIMPIHWGTFIQSDEPTEEPIARFTSVVQKPLSALTEIGETWTA